MAQNDNVLLTPEETAALLRVALSTLVRWRRLSRATGEYVGPRWVTLGHRTVVYRRSEIDAYIASREQRMDD